MGSRVRSGKARSWRNRPPPSVRENGLKTRFIAIFIADVDASKDRNRVSDRRRRQFRYYQVSVINLQKDLRNGFVVFEATDSDVEHGQRKRK